MIDDNEQCPYCYDDFEEVIPFGECKRHNGVNALREADHLAKELEKQYPGTKFFSDNE